MLYFGDGLRIGQYFGILYAGVDLACEQGNINYMIPFYFIFYFSHEIGV